MPNEYKTIKEDCKYWQHSCGLCGITGNDYCPRKCKDYETDDYDLYPEGMNFNAERNDS